MVLVLLSRRPGLIVIDKLESTIDYKSSHIAKSRTVFVDKRLSTAVFWFKVSHYLSSTWELQSERHDCPATARTTDGLWATFGEACGLKSNNSQGWIRVSFECCHRSVSKDVTDRDAYANCLLHALRHVFWQFMRHPKPPEDEQVGRQVERHELAHEEDAWQPQEEVKLRGKGNGRTEEAARLTEEASRSTLAGKTTMRSIYMTSGASRSTRIGVSFGKGI